MRRRWLAGRSSSVVDAGVDAQRHAGGFQFPNGSLAARWRRWMIPGRPGQHWPACRLVETWASGVVRFDLIFGRAAPGHRHRPWRLNVGSPKLPVRGLAAGGLGAARRVLTERAMWVQISVV